MTVLDYPWFPGCDRMTPLLASSRVDRSRGRKDISVADGVGSCRRMCDGGPIENPEHAVWIQSKTLQTALMQAYMAFRLSELTVALGVSFVAVGIGLAAMSHRFRE